MIVGSPYPKCHVFVMVDIIYLSSALMTDLHIVLAYVFMSQASCQADERSLAYN